MDRCGLRREAKHSHLSIRPRRKSGPITAGRLLKNASDCAVSMRGWNGTMANGLGGRLTVRKDQRSK